MYNTLQEQIHYSVGYLGDQENEVVVVQHIRRIVPCISQLSIVGVFETKARGAHMGVSQRVCAQQRHCSDFVHIISIRIK